MGELAVGSLWKRKLPSHKCFHFCVLEVRLPQPAFLLRRHLRCWPTHLIRLRVCGAFSSGARPNISYVRHFQVLVCDSNAPKRRVLELRFQHAP